MKEFGKVIFKDGHKESIIYEKIYDVDPNMFSIKFNTRTNEYVWKPLSEEEIEWQINHQANVVCVKDHAFYVKKDGKYFVEDNISYLDLSNPRKLQGVL